MVRSDGTQRLLLEARTALAGCQETLLVERRRVREEAFVNLMDTFSANDGQVAPRSISDRVDG